MDSRFYTFQKILHCKKSPIHLVSFFKHHGLFVPHIVAIDFGGGNNTEIITDINPTQCSTTHRMPSERPVVLIPFAWVLKTTNYCNMAIAHS